MPWSPITEGGMKLLVYAILLYGLNDQQSVIEVRIQSIRNEMAPSMRRQKWRRLEATINDLKARYNNGALTLIEYWESVKYVISDLN